MRVGSDVEVTLIRLPAPSPALAGEGTAQPQHFFKASSEVIDSTPGTGLSVMRVTPVLKNFRPGVFSGFFPVFLKFTMASTPIDAINSGYCIEVAPIKGNACYFSYDRAHVNTKSLHGGAPVLEGEKWVATKWLREREFI